MYLALKHIHMTLAIISIVGFLVRSLWLFLNNKMLLKKPVRIVPHIIDTFLLASGITLMVMTSQYPFSLTWMTYKIGFILTYIIFGIVMFRAKQKTAQAVFFILAISSVALVLYLAHHKTLPF